jgi:CSLREA domain-containing protein
VRSNNTDGGCSLREAIIVANTDAAVNACASVTVPTGTYTLTINDAGVALLKEGDESGR